MKTFQIGIACAAMLAFLLTLTGCGETSNKAKQQTKAEMKSAADTRPEEAAKVAADEQPARPEDDQVKQLKATTDGSLAGEAIEIPLNQIWAYDMPGTRDIRELEPDKFGEAVRRMNSGEQLRRYGESFTSQILKFLPSLDPGQKTKPAFAVLGTGRESLRNASKVIVEGVKPRETLSAEKEVSIVFFSHETGYYVHVHEVQIHQNAISIRYRLVPHFTKELTRNFAIVPLGRLSPGEYKVDVVQSPMEQKYASLFEPVEEEIENRIVCKSFEFKVDDARDKRGLK